MATMMEIDNPELNTFYQQRYNNLRLANGNVPPADREVSVASTRTAQDDSVIRDESSMEVQMVDIGTPFEGVPGDKYFTVSIDFGTTFSSVSFIALPMDEPNLFVHPEAIQSIINYPDEPSQGLRDKRREVPTESWYPSNPLGEVQNEPGNTLMTDSNEDPNEDAHEDGGWNNSCVQHGHSDADDEVDDDDSKDFFWGYGVQRQLEFPDSNRNQNRRVARSKLLLDSSRHTEDVRDELRPTLRRLKNRKLIKNDEDVIADYLEHLFRHTKEQLTTYHGFSDSCPLEFVLCVPAIWTQKACRTMQTAMETAIRKSEFGSVQNGSVEDLFIVSEPEAASAYVLAYTNEIQPGETFVLLDAGGGTVDAITYTVNRRFPLRLQREAVTPGGGLCGSSYLNEAFRKHLMARLEEEDYLEVNGLTIESIVEKEMVDFENRRKRAVDVTKPKFAKDSIFIQGLKANPEKRFIANRLRLDREDINDVFLPRLRAVAELMKEQLNLAREKHLEVKKVILIGGFAASPSLRNFLVQELAEISRTRGESIRLIDSKTPETAVASGAVLRALNKENGPARTTLSSYGFLRIEPYEPEVLHAHRNGVRPYHDPLDGKKYVKNTVDWLVKKGEVILPLREYRIPSTHTFSTKPGQRFCCRERLYVLDRRAESHYRLSDKRNRGAELAGEIVADMTFLKTDGLIVPVEPEEGEKGKRHYKVEYELVMIVDGRNMRYEARYPAGGAVQERGQISIAAAFLPGTN